MELAEAFMLTVITAATPLLLAAMGELIAERSGVLNLGVEGMMVTGAVAAFAGAQLTGSAYAGVVVGALAGAMLAALFAVLVLYFVTNQVATGLALTLFGLGLSGLIGASYVGQPGIKLAPLLGAPPTDTSGAIASVWSLVLGHDLLVYLSLASVPAVIWCLNRTRGGLVLRAVGDSHGSAHALGYSVLGVRFLAVLFGGAMAGLGGAYLSLVYTPQWTDAMTAGRGWIALALVVFASWLPKRVALGAYLFGGVTLLQFHLQAIGVSIPAQFLNALPYIATIVVLVAISGNRRLIAVNTPACLGKPFVPDR
ncbi:MAG: ABC transporter permease [Pseudomonadota bacterium]